MEYQTLFPDQPDQLIILPPPSDKTWRKFKTLIKMAKKEYENAEFEAQEKYIKAAWQMLDLWVDQYTKENTITTMPKIFKKGGKK